MGKKQQQFQKPTEGELEILRVLWRLGAATVKTVNQELSQGKEVGYTTTLKLMQIMYDKKMVTRKPHGRGHLYKTNIRKKDVQAALVNRLLDSAFGGSAKQLVMQALGNGKSSLKELTEIKEYIEQIEKETGK